MNVSTRKMINLLAKDILNIYDISVPIQNMGDIVEILGGTIQKETSFSGCEVEKKWNGFRIIVSPYQDETRERFTIAHELGHLFLHMGYRTNIELWKKQRNNTFYRIGSVEKEYEANEFAAAFLMPEKEYKRIAEKYSEGNTVFIRKVAEYFNVSVEAASYRGKWLGYLQ